MQPKNKKQIIKEFHEMKPSVAIKTMNFAKFPKEVAEKIKSDLSEISPEALDLQKDQSTFKKWIEQMAEMYPAVFGIVEEKKIEPKAPVIAEPSIDVLSSLETKVNELQTRLKVINKMIQKQPKKRDELKVRMKVVTKMIDKLNSQIKEAKSKSSKKKLPKKGLGGFLLGALGGFIAGQMIDLQLTRKKVRFQLGGTMEGDKKYKYSITYQTVTPESAEVGDYADNGYVIQDEVEELQDILQEAVNRYGIYEPSSVGYKDGKRSVSAGCWWSSTSPDTDRDYWEKGHEKYYSLHINNIDGSELNQEESQFITDKLSEARNLHWDDEEKKWWRDGGQIHSEDKDGELIFKADTKGGKYSIEVRESNDANGVSYSTYEYTGGSLRGMGGNNNREILIHRLLDTIIGSKKIDSINYIISVDKLGVKDYLPYAENIYDIYNSKEIREWYVALPQEKKDELTKYSNEKAIKYVKDNNYRYDDSTIGSFASIFRREKMVKDFYESQGKVILENGGSFIDEREKNISKFLKDKPYPLSKEELNKLSKETGYSQGDIEYVSQKLNDDIQYNVEYPKKEFKNGGNIKTDFNELKNSELRSVLISFWNDLINNQIFSYLQMGDEDYVLSDVDSVFVVFRDRKFGNFSDVEKANIERFLRPYFDSNSKPLFSKFFDKFEIDGNRIVIHIKKGKIFYNGGRISDTPKVYIADLAAYNEGKLVGEWIDLSEFSSGDEVMDKISELLAKWSKEQGEEREEYAVHDMENFPNDLYHESMGKKDFQSVIDYWEAVGNSDYPKEVIEEYMSVKGEDNASDAVSSMDKSYQGKYSSKSDFAEQLVSDIGMPSNVSDYAYVTDTDRRIIAGEEADNVLDDMTDDEILERADMKEDADAYKEKESEIESLEEEINSLDKEEDADELEKKEEELEELKNELAEMDTYDEVLKKAKEEIHDEIYYEWYDGLEDPYYFLVKDKGLYDDETFMKQSFIGFDYDKFAKELEADYTMIEHDGDVYVFSDNYKKGGNVGITNKVGMKKWNSMNSEQRKDFAMIHLGVGKRQQMILQKKKYEELPVRVKKELEKIK